MKNNYLYLFTLISILALGCSKAKQEEIIEEELLLNAAKRLEKALITLNDTSLNPRSFESGKIRFVPSRDWTSGFFPGILWYMYETTGNANWLQPAHHYSMNIKEEQFNGGTHDMGFKIYCSFGNGYRIVNNSVYREILIQSARTLITRFSPITGSIRSWDHNSDKWDYPVIIDNMMNLELLFWATRATGDSVYYNIANTHAETTLKNHFREDNSSYHVISFDTLTGEVVKRNTHQGFDHHTAWARGQAWGLYGFTMTYRETGDKKFLEQAMAIADFIIQHPNLPEDKIPFWDFDTPGGKKTLRDVSAAAIIASALYELSTYSKEKSVVYQEVADQILISLSTSYLLETEEPVPFILDHSVGNFPKQDEIDVPIIYADYYYIEALMRRKALGL